MTIEQLAEMEYPVFMMAEKDRDGSKRMFDANKDQRAAFIKGLEHAVEIAKWIRTNDNVWIERDGYQLSPGVGVTETELINYFITEKYGSNEQQ